MRTALSRDAFRIGANIGAIGVLGVLLPSLSGCMGPGRDERGFRIDMSVSLVRPEGAPWTILCLELRGPDCFGRAEQFAESLQRTPGIRSDDVIVVAVADDLAQLYYGTYFRRTDPKTGKRSVTKQLSDDIGLIKELSYGGSQHPFLGARILRVPTPDVGNPDWVLSKVKAAYSLQVAVFEPTDDFWEPKRAAASYCSALRDKGYEAYYHHAPGSSMVTVGLFGEDAVIEENDKLPRYSAEVRSMQRDEWLKYNRLNGRVYKARTDRGVKISVESRLVRIPKADGTSWLP